MPHKSVAYVREAGGPGELATHVSDIQGSGLTTAILIGLHIGFEGNDDPTVNPPNPTQKCGDFIYNNYPADLIVRGGAFNPPNPDPDTKTAAANNAAIAKWPEQVAQLKQKGVRSVFLAVGGPKPYWKDFTVIQDMFAAGKADMLQQNIVALKEAFTIDRVCTIDGFDIDCEEEDIKQDTIVRFCEMVFALGFQVTFCPYLLGTESWWRDCMQTLWKKGLQVSGWNLQCYSGGKDNLTHLSSWLAALASVVGKETASSYLIPGLAVEGEADVCGEWHCPFGPDSFETFAAGWKDRKLGGMFLWRYDCVAENPTLCGGENNLASYVKAINQGLKG